MFNFDPKKKDGILKLEKEIEKMKMNVNHPPRIIIWNIIFQIEIY